MTAAGNSAAADSARTTAGPDTRVVIVGASLAGLRAAGGLRSGGFAGPIIVVGDEAQMPYDRPPLSKQVLSGGRSDPAFALAPDLNVEWRLRSRAISLDLGSRSVTIDHRDGEYSLEFDQLIVATGARARPWPGDTPAGVHLLRTLSDAHAIAAQLENSPRVVVVGAGFIGLEVAASCRQRGLPCAVIEPLNAPIARAVGVEIGQRVTDLHRAHGVDVRLGVGVSDIEGNGQVEAVVTTAGERIPADLVVIGIGAVPNTEWLSGSGLDLDDGLLCDCKLRALASGQVVPGVFAAGDVCRWHHSAWGEDVRIEHWTNAVDQAHAVARAVLADGDVGAFSPTPYVWSDQFGLKLQIVGRVLPGDEVELVESGPDHRFLAKAWRAGRIVAAIGMGHPARVMRIGREIN